MNIISKHIPFERLADAAEGRLAHDEREATLAHLNSCEQCAGRLARLSEVITLMRTDAAEDAPRAVVAGVVDSFRSREKRVGVGRRILAALSFDSAKLAPAFGVRSGVAASRQLLYSAGECDLDLRVTPADETLVVSGQVLGECAGGLVQLESESGEVPARAELNDLCEFALPPVPNGSYTLRLILPDLEIEVPGLEIRL